MNTHMPRVIRFMYAAMAVGILTVGAGASASASAPSDTRDAAPAARMADREGPQFYSGAFVDVTGDVDGDVYVAGQSVTISGNVTGDVIAAAQTITITGTVDGNVRLAAQTITVSGDVTRSGTVFAADANIADTGSLGGDLVGAASTIAIAGDIGRDVLISVDRLTVRGSVGGDLSYVSGREGRISVGAVDGSVERIAPPRSERVEVSPWAALAGWLVGLLYALVALSLVTVVAGLLIPRWLQRVTDHLVPSPWKALLVGFVASIAIPIVLLFLLITVIGAPLAIAGWLVWVVLTLATFVIGAYYLGRLLFRGALHPVLTSLVGGVILIVALQIPWVNVLVWFAMVFFGLGAQLLEFYASRPWQRTRTLTSRQPSDGDVGSAVAAPQDAR